MIRFRENSATISQRPLYVPLPYPFREPGIFLGLRNPYSFVGYPDDIPPVPLNAGQWVDGVSPDGVAIVAGMVLQPIHNSGPQGESAPVASFDTGKYADSVIFTVTFNGAGLPVDANGNTLNFVLPRPNNTRVLLTVQNLDVPGPIYYNWDAIASNIGCMMIPQSGSLDRSGGTVPQGNLSLYSTGTGHAQIEYANANVTK